ncbi:hypothetical protein Pst134EA_011150 [Puccinia striiformis f. sp. tritici]|uniref:uncharacterized protein n=1 Tax=Puccinia striiformis f. sp. tritici TaxID=168172 RepID=UPI0020082010|nr:uncharacterized protein Pst134EA_031396 [Puccinia striiformis f. sp. tritici]XP_047806963.1 hypothetical protein Pst134EA_011150 [Puccinia striiformis f. sp. tritici]KAH9445315.1 hypothetical protein Pst134EA_031396 [Puccinia striiformis f. sp. tritici]KAH9467509.1 hypothetical protein Pst134EA_011150 [Puccinia striiformis f. sp. tritici]KAI9604772.1 hypothetical protein H4Q26_002741 [Puccinia striiformis f. sp. tritici PST-130]
MKLNRLPLSCLPSSQVRFATSRRISSLGNEEYQKINFYSNSHVLRYAEMEAVPFSLRQLIFFGKVLGRHGSNVEELDHSLVQGANFTRVQLPIRLARQIREFQSLPYIVTSNSYLTETYQIYVDAFEKIRSYPEIRCRQDNLKWCQFLESLLNEHKIVIPKLAIGVAESANHLTNSQIEQFMTRMLYSRISRRVLAEHHIALTRQFQDESNRDPSTDNFRYLGVIDTELEIGKVVEKCIGLAQSTLNLKNSSPYSSKPVSVLVHGQKNAKFAYIADHLEFILFELLLNAFRATVTASERRSIDITKLPIDVQIASSPTHITIRISDQAGGILQSWRPSSTDNDDETLPPTVSRREMFSFVNLTTANDSLKQLISSTDGIMEGKVREQVEVNHQQIPPSSSQSSTSSASSNNIDGFEQIQEARLRIGLPLSSIYAQFLGGSLEMYSMKGFSSIVLSIPKLGTTNEPYN